MTSVSILRSALGLLQDDPDDDKAWSTLRDALGFTSEEGSVDPGEIGAPDLAKLLAAARDAHASRGEHDAAAKLLAIEAALATGDAEVDLVRALARLRDEVLVDDAAAEAAYARLVALRPEDDDALDALDRVRAKRAKWKDLEARYLSEAEGTTEPTFKSSLLTSAAEVLHRFGGAAVADESDPGPVSERSTGKGKGKKKKGAGKAKDAAAPSGTTALARLEEALALDPKNRRAAELVERILRADGDWEKLATALARTSNEAAAKDDRVAALLRLARVCKSKLRDGARAADVYASVLDLAPGHREATSALVDHFTAHEQWDELVALYDDQLASGGVKPGQELDVVFQIAMVHWKTRGRADAAEPYFERLRRAEPAHPGMLSFFRELCTANAEPQRLQQILTDAQRATTSPEDRAKLAAEVAQLAEEGANAQKAIEQWRNVLRAEPTNRPAREALRRLFRQTGAYNHLADLLRSDLERTAPTDRDGKLGILREIAALYRDAIKSDSALVTVLAQIIQLAPEDTDAVRELSRVYESLGRWRDLLTTQMRLAELEADGGVKAELYRAIARRWQDQFSNVQNAVEAYEKLRENAPADREASEKLIELYGKRRSYRQLYELYEAELARAEGAERLRLGLELAKLAAERLDRPAEATRLYEQLVAEHPEGEELLVMLERHAEREKDHAALARALSHRVDRAKTDELKLAALLKLGALYTERLADTRSALDVYRRVLALSPGHTKALRVVRDGYLTMGDYDALEALHAESSDWEGLVETLSSAADREADPERKVDLSLRCARILEDRLGAPERAFRSYERVLTVRPGDRRAAAALVLIYEADESWARLPGLYEALLAHASDDVERRGLCRKLAAVLGSRLGDKAAAFGWARKAYEIGPDDEALAELEALARATGDHAGFTSAVEARLASADATAAEKRRLRMKLADLAAVHAGRPDDAIGAYRALLEANPADAEAMQALDRLLRASPDRREDLRWLFRLRVDRAEGAARAELLTEWAQIEEEAFAEPARAAALYRELLTVRPDDQSALGAVARLLLAAGDARGAADALEKKRDLAEGPARAALDVELGRILAGSLREPNAALAAARRAIEIVGFGAGPVALLEELLPMPETRTPAATLLDDAYASMGAHAKQADVLMVLIATAPSKHDRLALFGRLATVRERMGDVQGAFEIIQRSADEFPAELETWDRLAVLARKAHKTRAFVEQIARAVPESGETGLPVDVELDLAERAATLYDESLGDIDRASPYLARILARDPGSARAFARQKQILTTRERWSELETLYERALDATTDPMRRVDLLTEVAIIAEEITGNVSSATRHYERILEVEPGNEQAIRALDKLYESQERWPALADLLARRLRLELAPDPLAMKLRLGVLLFEKLDDPRGALDALEPVVDDDPDAPKARDIVEKCLAHPDLRQRAALVLEGVYADREDIQDLVRVLEVRLEGATDDGSRHDLLRRIAELRDERLSDDAGAFDAFAKLLPLSPADAAARTRFVEIARRRDRLAAAAEVLLVAGDKADAPQPRADIFGEVARIFEEVGQTERASEVHRRALDLAPDDAEIAGPAARALERVYMTLGRHKDLAQVLAIEVGLETDKDARHALLGRLAQVSETMLSDDATAIAAWRQRLEDDPGDAEALSALDRLHSRSGEARALVDVLRLREQRVSGTERKDVMIRCARTLGERLAELDEAILAYRAVLDDFGADRTVLAELVKLYETADRHRDLVEALEEELALSDTSAERARILTRIGDLRRTKLAEPEEALEAYRQALSLEPADAATRASVAALLENETVKREAAELLRPLFEADADRGKLLVVLDILVATEESPAERLVLLAQAVEVAEAESDPTRAFAYASRGVRETARESELPEWVARAKRVAERGNAWAELVTLLREVEPEIDGDERRLEVLLEIGQLARERLADAPLAKEHFRRALAVAPEEPRALGPLERLHGEAGENEELVEILETRARIATSDDDRRSVLREKARVCEDVIGDKDRAIDAHEEILELSFDRAAATALERLYRAQSRFGDLVALYEKEIPLPETSGARRADLRHALGSVHELDLQEMDRAFDEYSAALDATEGHGPTVAALERLMEGKVHASRAAEMLEGVYLGRLDWRRVMATVTARLDATDDPTERRTYLTRLAKLHEEQEENYRAALDVTARVLAEDLTDETTWAELERLARVAGAEARLAEIYATELEKLAADEPATARLARRTGEIFEKLGDVERSLVFYRRAYRFAPEEEATSFDAIDRLLKQVGRPAERVELHRGSLEYREGAEARLATLHTIAVIEETELHDVEAAMLTARTALEIDDLEPVAQATLERLLTAGGRFGDLAELLRRRAESSALPEDEAKCRLDLADVLEQRLGETGAALDELETVLGLVTKAGDLRTRAVTSLETILGNDDYRARAVALLSPVYEGSDDWKKIVALGKHRLDVAGTPHEKVLVLRETARLHETRGNDAEQALACVADAFALDPQDDETRGELDRLALAHERWDALATAYERGLERSDDAGRRELLEALARLHDKRRDDPRRALAAWERLYALDESDRRPLDEMDMLATLLSDWPALVRVLGRRAELATDPEERASLFRRVGEAHRDMLDDEPKAIEAYERALEIEPESTFTIDSLIALHERAADETRLADLYRRRIALTSDEDVELRGTLLLDAARVVEKALGDRREAIALYEQALALRAGDRAILDELGRLYEAEKMWPELLENVKTRAVLAEGENAFVLHHRAARILATELSEPARAVLQYRDVLRALAAVGRPYDASVFAELSAIAEAHEDLRLEVAGMAEPVARAAGKHDAVVAALELRLSAETEADARARSLAGIADVLESDLGDTARALDATLRALAETPADVTLHDKASQRASKLGRDGAQRYADALEAQAAAVFDAPLLRDLLLRLGALLERDLGELARSAEAYGRAAAQGGDSIEVLTALERVHGQLGDAAALADLLERRAALEEDALARADVQHRLAVVQLGPLGAKPSGLATLRLALERAPSHEASRRTADALLDDGATFEDAFEMLAIAYRATASGESLGKLYARRVERAGDPGSRVRARLDLARVLEDEAGDPRGAQRALEAALPDDVRDDDLLAALERLAEKNGALADAAGALASALEAQTATTDEALAERWARLGAWRRDRLGDRRAAEAAYRKAMELDAENVAHARAFAALVDDPTRTRERIDALQRLLRLEGDPEEIRRLGAEIVRLAEGILEDRALAEQAVRAVMAENDADPWANEELTRLRDLAGDHEAVVALLQKRADLTMDAAAAGQLRHRAADVLASKLGDKNRAAQLYAELRETDPSDRIAEDRLRTLYTELAAWKPLARLLADLVSSAPSVTERSALRLELARLSRDRFAAADDAIDLLKAILEEEPAHREATEELGALFAEVGRHREHADLLEATAGRARDAGDEAAEVAALGRLGAVLDEKLADPGEALKVYERITARRPDDRYALEATARIAEARSAWDQAANALQRLAATEPGEAGVAFALRLAKANAARSDDEGEKAALRLALEKDGAAQEARTRLADLLERTSAFGELAELLVAGADRLRERRGDTWKPPVVGAPVVRGSLAPPGGSMAPRGSLPPLASVPPPDVPADVFEEVQLLVRAADLHATKRASADDAVPLLERASTLVPHDRELALKLCDVYSASRRERDAASVLERIISSFGQRRNKELSVYHHRLGRALASLGDRDVALTQLDLAFKIDPGSIEVLKDLGVLAIEANDLERAQKTFRALLLQKLDPASPISKGQVFAYLGEISMKQGDKPKAVQMLERALENEPGLDRAKTMLAELKS